MTIPSPRPSPRGEGGAERPLPPGEGGPAERDRVRGVLACLFFIATAASGHSIVDIAMSINAPKFVPAQQSFTYHVIADDQNNDNGSGIVVTIVLPPSIKFSGVSGGSVFRCSESKLTLTCSAEIIPPGPNPIDVSVIAPAAVGSIHATAHTESLGSLDLNGNNDNASADVMIYDPAACHAMTPLILGPADESSQPAVVPLAWSSVDGAQSYTIFTAVEGAAAAPMSATAKTNLALTAEPGRSEWWVEATFGNCPPIDSEHRHFTVASTVARNVVTYSGDPNVAATRDGTRSTATFNRPFGLALSPQNEMYVSDEADNVVRKIAGDAVVIIAGSPGAAGATEGQFAQFRNPRGLAVTPFDGYVYAADTMNQEIRILYTGGPFVPAFGVAGAALIPGNADGVGNASRFNTPSGLAATRRGNLYVADTQNNLIRKMTQVTGYIGLFTISTIAGGFHAPLGVAVDANETVYVADTDDHTIRKIVNGVVSVVAGESGVVGSSDGRGGQAHFDHPTGIALDARGNLFVTDRNGVRRIAPSGLVSTVATGFNAPAGIIVDASDRIFVADSANHIIRLIEPATVPPPTPTRRRAVH